MTTNQHANSAGDGGDGLPETALRELTDGLLVLWRAYSYAQDAGADRWEFAIEIQQFYDLGLTNNELRWLVAKGLAEHAQESSACGDTRRSFVSSDGLTFSETSALLLTESGAAFASQVYAAWQETGEAAARDKTLWTGLTSSERPAKNGKGDPQAARKPTWDAHRRELRVGGVIVKRFRVPAASQEAALDAFQEESWPDYIDDPLPGVADGVPKQRLHNAIKGLNDNQTACLIRFHGNGRGEGIGWALIAEARRNGNTKPTGRVNGHRTSSSTSSIRGAVTKTLASGRLIPEILT